MRRYIMCVLSLSVLLCASGCGDDDSTGPAPVQGDPFLEIVAPAEAAGGTLTRGMRLRTLANAEVRAEVLGGGGHIDGDILVADSKGDVEVPWTLGIPPVANTIRLTLVEDESVTEDVIINVAYAEPVRSEDFADIHTWLTDEEIEGSTEDLAFLGDSLFMGAPPHVIEIAPDGSKSVVPTVDEAFGGAWGLAVDRDGTLWVADPGNKSLSSVTLSGEVTLHFTEASGEPMLGPNYVAVGPNDGHVFVTDPCSGRVIRFDPDAGEIVGEHTFERLEGGPNGLAFDETGDKLYVITESTGFLCQHTEIPFDEEHAGLFTIDMSTFGDSHDTIVADFALFGDGIAFDVEGNLYAVIDNQKDFVLEESLVVVLRKGETEFVPFITAAPTHLFANVAFGTDAFGRSTLYMSLLKLPLLSGTDSRGVERLEVGIEGLPLLP